MGDVLRPPTHAPRKPNKVMQLGERVRPGQQIQLDAAVLRGRGAPRSF